MAIEQKLSRGVIFDARKGATVFGNYLDRTLQVVPHGGKRITAEDIDSAIKTIFVVDCNCSHEQIQNMIWEGGPVSADV